MGNIKIAIAGAGNIAQNAHLPVYAAREDVEVVAICDINLDRARAAAAKFGIPNAFASAREMIRDVPCDAVDICVWNRAHMEVAVLAAEAGRHILCEKPMALNVQHAQAMESAVDRTGIVFMMAMPRRFLPEVRYVERMAKAGKLGDIYYARANLIRRRGTPLGWFTDTSKSGGGPIIDIGVHAIDCAWFMMGRPKPVRISAMVSRAIGDYKTQGVSRWVALDSDVTAFDTEDSATGIIHFENGAAMSLDISWAINMEQVDTTTVCGSLAGACIDHREGIEKPLTIYSEAEGYLVDTKPTFQRINPFAEEIDCFLSAIASGEKPDASLQDGMTMIRMLMGIYESAKEGREIIL